MLPAQRQAPEASVLDLFLQRGRQEPDRPLFTFVDDDGRDVEHLSFGQAVEHARACAHFAREQCGLRPGDRVVLVYPPSLDFSKAFLGCMLGGFIPVPVCPPDPTLPADVKRFAIICASAQAKAIWTNREYQLGRQLGRLKGAVQRVFQGARSDWPELPWFIPRAPSARELQALPDPRVTPDDVALLQYTSGSTSTPKGVMITHGNLLHQLTTNAEELAGNADGRLVMWVPHFHDFGLISGILNAAIGNGRLYMMSPLSFIKRPAVWMEVLSRVRATHTAAPDFAYDLVLRKTTATQRASWDLSQLRVAMSAAEPVRARVVEAFREAFAPSGFAPGAFCPAYGLAEHTVGVSVFGRGTVRVDRDALEREGVARQVEAGGVELVACGAPSKGVRVCVVDPETRTVRAEGEVGELWVDSPSKAAGYFGMPEETERTFQARVSGDSTGYLRTGDLGFQLGGQLYITGRLKDLLVVRGRNVYPQDIEENLRSAHPLVRPGGVVAFGVDDASGQEQLAVIVEVRVDRPGKQVLEELARAVRQCVTENHQLGCHTLVLARSGVVQKTTSGKLQRRAARQSLVSGELQRHPDVLLVQVREQAPAAPEPRLQEGPDAEFQQIIEASRARFEGVTRARGGRVFHQRATVLAGHLEVLETPRLPPNTFFTPGRRLPVVARYANGVADDDALWDNRGATLRLLDPARPEALDAPLLDLLLTTGQRFPQGTAASFHRWLTASASEREAWLREHPEVGEAAWEMMRAPASYARLHYYSKVASHFVDANGARWFARFRILPPEKPTDEGFVDTGGVPIPPERMTRKPGDTRPAHFLHDELRARMEAGGVSFLLQVQLQPAGEGSDGSDAALDCSRSWPEARHPWRDVALLRFERVLPEEQATPLRFNPCHAPPELAMPLARSPHEYASLNHLRSIIYEQMAEVRAGLRSNARAAPVRKEPEPPLRICIVGAGVSGLTAARELERRGHRVTVLEKLEDIGGKSASVEIGGRQFDLGGHYCTDNYQHLAALVRELGIRTESATPGITLDAETGRVLPTGDPASLGEHFLRYTRLRDQEFPELKRPGLARVARKLSEPVLPWLERNGLVGLGGALEVTYTASGYDSLRGTEQPALYLLKAAETFVGADKRTGLPRAWTIEGGFANLWRRMADELQDVRRGVAVQRVIREGGQVRVQTREETLVCDRLIIATPLHHALEFLDAHAEERELFGRIRHLDYYTTVCTVSGLPRQGFYLLQQHCTDPSKVGHCVAFHHRYPDSDVTLFYSYGNEHLGPEEVLRLLKQDIERLGGQLETVHLQRRWAYFPHFSGPDIAEGAYARLEALQGQRQTFYLNSVFNFELVECNVAYAVDLVERFFGERPVPVSRPAHTPAVVGTASRTPGPVEYLQHVVAESLQLGTRLPSPDAEFANLGMDSVRAVELSTRITRDTGLELSPAALRHFPTLEELGRHLAGQLQGRPLPSLGEAPSSASALVADSRGGEDEEEWFVFPQPLEVPRARLICFHHAGGSAEWFQGWATRLPEGIELCAVQLPGRGRNAGRPCHRLDVLVEELEERLAPLMDVPCAFFGHSMGAILATAVATRLQARGRSTPRHLFVSSLPSPAHYRRGAPLHLLSDKELARFQTGVDLASLEPSTRARLLQRLRADLRLVDTWDRAEVRPLDLPVTALGGDQDRAVPLEALRGWAALTTRGFTFHQLPGGHMYPEQQLPALAEVLAPLLRELGQETPPRVRLDLGRELERLRQRCEAAPSSLAGAWNLLDLCWMARARRQDGSGPRYPDALRLLLARQAPGGELLEPSPHPLCNLATTLTMANTLIAWETGGGEESRRRIEGLIAQAVRQLEVVEKGPNRTNDSRYGRFHHFPGFWGEFVWVKEAEQLLERGGAYATAAQREALRHALATRPNGAGVNPFEQHIDFGQAFSKDLPVLYLGEYLPEEAFRVPEAREQAHRVGVTGFSAACTVRYCEATGDELISERLGARLARDRDGLWLEGAVMESAFILKYLGEGGLDPRLHVPGRVEYLLGSLREEGITFSRDVRLVECDISAVAQLVCHTWGLPTKMPSHRLVHDLWNEQARGYQTLEGRDVYDVSTVLHVLGACMVAPDLDDEEKQRVWTRSLRLLDERPWVELYHLSPLYSWQQVIAFVGGHAHRFPEHPTRAHEDALALMLQLQQPCGGFQSHLLDAPNEEETGLALLAMKDAMAWPRSRSSWLELRHRVNRAEHFLKTRLVARQGVPTHPDMWMAKLSYSALNVIESILLAGLSKPVPTWVPPA
jgi:acyl-CoA synthetase (AMP-forming)/AMP-acid ligase II/surfactin synthase thioesterase subunit/protoporphyrinogen oxidase/acyl carrier protein